MKRQELVRVLELVAPALSNQMLVEVFTHFMFTKGHVSAFDDVLAIVAKADVSDTAFSVSGKTLLDLLKNSSGDEADFTIKDEHVLVKAGRSTFKLPYSSEDDFIFEVPKEKWVVTVPIDEDVLRGLDICIGTTARDETMRALMGVFLNVEKGAAFYSCNGDTVSKFVLDGKVKGAGKYHMLPNKFVDALLRITKETETTQGEIRISDRWACAVLNNGFTLYGKQIEADGAGFDPAEQLADTVPGKVAYVDVPKGLPEALARARVVADRETAPTALSVASNRLRLHTEAHLGTVNDDLPIKGHADVEAKIHASLLAPSLEVCTKMSICDNCTIFRLDDKVLQVIANIGE